MLIWCPTEVLLADDFFPVHLNVIPGVGLDLVTSPIEIPVSFVSFSSLL